MKIVPLCALCSVAVLMFLLHAAVADVKPLKLTVRPLIAFAPVDLQIQIRVQPDESDRWIAVGLDTEEFSRSSGFTIEPDRRLYTVSWRNVPAGEYVIVARIGHGDQVRASDSARVLVSGP